MTFSSDNSSTSVPTTIAVATTISPRFDHVSAIESQHSNVFIAQRCESLAELIAVARTGLVEAIIIADQTEQMSASFRETLTSPGTGTDSLPAVGVLVMTDLASERDRLANLGFLTAAPTDEPAELIEKIRRSVTVNEDPMDAELSKLVGQGSEPQPLPQSEGRCFDAGAQAIAVPNLQGSAIPDTDTTAELPASAPKSGTITAVWGPTGAPGRTTIAINLAAEFALAGQRTLLIDADTYGPAIAVCLGVLNDSAGIAQACRAAEQDRLTGAQLVEFTQRIAVAGNSSLQVLTGLTRPDRWPELRATSIDRLLAAARETFDQIVVDTGFGIEEDEELSFDIPAPQRNATTVTTLKNADQLVLVGTGDPVGLPRMMAAADQIRELLAQMGSIAPVIPVVNKVSRTTSGLRPQNQIREVWSAFGTSALQPQYFLPATYDKCAQAQFNGQVLAEAAPKHELRLQLQTLAGQLISISSAGVAGGMSDGAGQGVVETPTSDSGEKEPAIPQRERERHRARGRRRREEEPATGRKARGRREAPRH